MRIFHAFLVVFTVAILFFLPVSDGVYDYRTDLQSDSFSSSTGPGETTEAVVLNRPLYDNDTSSFSLLSSESSDTPAVSTYVSATRNLTISGLAESTNRTLTVEYDIDALNASAAINTFMGYVPTIWILVILAFPVLAMVAIFMGRA